MDATVAELVGQLEEEWRQLRARLDGIEPARLTTPGRRGGWPVIDNLRHLLFAEEIHLGRYVPGGWTPSPAGVPPDGMASQKRLAHLERAGAPFDPAAVFAAWEEAHEAIRPHLAETPEIQVRLDRHLRHLRAHIRVIERLMRQ
jgi:hypothetical protein